MAITHIVVVVAVLALAGAAAQDAVITVRADRPLHRISRLLTGACLEDVNHEVYGGIYSQMLFGESFQEPAPTPPIRGFRAYGGTWRVREGAVWGSGASGPKLVAETEPFRDGAVSVEALIPDAGPGLACLLLRVASPGVGADAFDGFEVSLDASAQMLRIGRHRQNWAHIADVPCRVPVNEWIPLTVRLEGSTVEVLVSGETVLRHDEGANVLPAGVVALRPWQREVAYRRLTIETGGIARQMHFEQERGHGDVSGMWRPVVRGSAEAAFSLDRREPFVGPQSQAITFARGSGEAGIENGGLNRCGLHLEGGKSYEGRLCLRVAEPTEVWAALETGDGARALAEKRLQVKPGAWRACAFALEPSSCADGARFTISLRRPGSVSVGYASLQPGLWGRFKGLPVRRDVAEALVDQGITVLRYGGSMINHPEYRWKNMIGPRDQRPPTPGTWYPWSSNGWAIVDFIAFCRAAGFECIPALNMGETPQDLADFVEYTNGADDTPWGRKRAEHGFREPFRLRYIELGNEERVDAAYASRFALLARSIWSKDPDLIIVVGDFVYSDPIADPMNLTGAASGIRDMSGHEAILRLAREHGREVWFDVHVGTDGPGPSREMAALPSYVRALDALANGARHRVVVFEFNAGNHSQRRALANAVAIAECERLNLPIATSANCLQPDGQNDNGWDQGLLFLNPAKVWLQPPGWVTQMVSRSFEPVRVEVERSGMAAGLDVSALRSDDGSRLTLRVVNTAAESVTCSLGLEGFAPKSRAAEVETLAAPLDAKNTASAPTLVRPVRGRRDHALATGTWGYTFAPHSLTIIRLR